MTDLADVIAAKNGPGTLAQRRRAMRHRLIDVLEERAAENLPLTRGSVTVTSIERVEINGDPWLRINGSGGGISWPIQINYPPILADDPTGPIVDRTYEDGSRLFGLASQLSAVNVVHERRFRFAPFTALGETIRQLIKDAQ